LFQRLYTEHHSGGGNGRAGATYLFGSIFGISATQAVVSVFICAGVCIAMAAIARPLLFASIDEAVAVARGVPVRLLGAGFLIVVGVTCAQAAQAVGALLLLGLISAPAGAAHRLTTRPFVGLALAAAIAVLSTWAGLLISYLVPRTPPSFAIIGVATLSYLLTFAWRPDARSRRPARARAGHHADAALLPDI
jgi:zinc/manganese transport system permease protein